MDPTIPPTATNSILSPSIDIPNQISRGVKQNSCVIPHNSSDTNAVLSSPSFFTDPLYSTTIQPKDASNNTGTTTSRLHSPRDTSDGHVVDTSGRLHPIAIVAPAQTSSFTNQHSYPRHSDISHPLRDNNTWSKQSSAFVSSITSNPVSVTSTLHTSSLTQASPRYSSLFATSDGSNIIQSNGADGQRGRNMSHIGAASTHTDLYLGAGSRGLSAHSFRPGLVSLSHKHSHGGGAGELTNAQTSLPSSRHPPSHMAGHNASEPGAQDASLTHQSRRSDTTPALGQHLFRGQPSATALAHSPYVRLRPPTTTTIDASPPPGADNLRFSIDVDRVNRGAITMHHQSNGPATTSATGRPLGVDLLYPGLKMDGKTPLSRIQHDTTTSATASLAPSVHPHHSSFATNTPTRSVTQRPSASIISPALNYTPLSLGNNLLTNPQRSPSQHGARAPPRSNVTPFITGAGSSTAPQQTQIASKGSNHILNGPLSPRDFSCEASSTQDGGAQSIHRHQLLDSDPQRNKTAMIFSPINMRLSAQGQHVPPNPLSTHQSTASQLHQQQHSGRWQSTKPMELHISTLTSPMTLPTVTNQYSTPGTLIPSRRSSHEGKSHHLTSQSALHPTAAPTLSASSTDPRQPSNQSFQQEFHDDGVPPTQLLPSIDSQTTQEAQDQPQSSCDPHLNHGYESFLSYFADFFAGLQSTKPKTNRRGAQPCQRAMDAINTQLIATSNARSQYESLQGSYQDSTNHLFLFTMAQLLIDIQSDTHTAALFHELLCNEDASHEVTSCIPTPTHVSQGNAGQQADNGSPNSDASRPCGSASTVDALHTVLSAHLNTSLDFQTYTKQARDRVTVLQGIRKTIVQLLGDYTPSQYINHPLRHEAETVQGASTCPALRQNPFLSSQLTVPLASLSSNDPPSEKTLPSLPESVAVPCQDLGHHLLARYSLTKGDLLALLHILFSEYLIPRHTDNGHVDDGHHHPFHKSQFGDRAHAHDNAQYLSHYATELIMEGAHRCSLELCPSQDGSPPSASALRMSMSLMSSEAIREKSLNIPHGYIITILDLLQNLFGLSNSNHDLRVEASPLVVDTTTRAQSSNTIHAVIPTDSQSSKTFETVDADFSMNDDDDDDDVQSTTGKRPKAKKASTKKKGVKVSAKLIAKTLKRLGPTSFNTMCDEITAEMAALEASHDLTDPAQTAGSSSSRQASADSVRRRIYEAFNSLVSLNAVAKYGKTIEWIGLVRVLHAIDQHGVPFQPHEITSENKETTTRHTRAIDEVKGLISTQISQVQDTLTTWLKLHKRMKYHHLPMLLRVNHQMVNSTAIDGGEPLPCVRQIYNDITQQTLTLIERLAMVDANITTLWEDMGGVCGNRLTMESSLASPSSNQQDLKEDLSPARKVIIDDSRYFHGSPFRIMPPRLHPKAKLDSHPTQDVKTDSDEACDGIDRPPAEYSEMGISGPYFLLGLLQHDLEHANTGKAHHGGFSIQEDLFLDLNTQELVTRTTFRSKPDALLPSLGKSESNQHPSLLVLSDKDILAVAETGDIILDDYLDHQLSLPEMLKLYPSNTCNASSVSTHPTEEATVASFMVNYDHPPLVLHNRDFLELSSRLQGLQDQAGQVRGHNMSIADQIEQIYKTHLVPNTQVTHAIITALLDTTAGPPHLCKFLETRYGVSSIHSVPEPHRPSALLDFFHSLFSGADSTLPPSMVSSSLSGNLPSAHTVRFPAAHHQIAHQHGHHTPLALFPGVNKAQHSDIRHPHENPSNPIRTYTTLQNPNSQTGDHQHNGKNPNVVDSSSTVPDPHQESIQPLQASLLSQPQRNQNQIPPLSPSRTDHDNGAGNPSSSRGRRKTIPSPVNTPSRDSPRDLHETSGQDKNGIHYFSPSHNQDLPPGGLGIQRATLQPIVTSEPLRATAIPLVPSTDIAASTHAGLHQGPRNSSSVHSLSVQNGLNPARASQPPVNTKPPQNAPRRRRTATQQVLEESSIITSNSGTFSTRRRTTRALTEEGDQAGAYEDAGSPLLTAAATKPPPKRTRRDPRKRHQPDHFAPHLVQDRQHDGSRQSSRRGSRYASIPTRPQVLTADDELNEVASSASLSAYDSFHSSVAISSQHADPLQGHIRRASTLPSPMPNSYPVNSLNEIHARTVSGVADHNRPLSILTGSRSHQPDFSHPQLRSNGNSTPRLTNTLQPTSRFDKPTDPQTGGDRHQLTTPFPHRGLPFSPTKTPTMLRGTPLPYNQPDSLGQSHTSLLSSFRSPSLVMPMLVSGPSHGTPLPHSQQHTSHPQYTVTSTPNPLRNITSQTHQLYSQSNQPGGSGVKLQTPSYLNQLHHFTPNRANISHDINPASRTAGGANQIPHQALRVSGNSQQTPTTDMPTHQLSTTSSGSTSSTTRSLPSLVSNRGSTQFYGVPGITATRTPVNTSGIAPAHGIPRTGAISGNGGVHAASLLTPQTFTTATISVPHGGTTTRTPKIDTGSATPIALSEAGLRDS